MLLNITSATMTTVLFSLADHQGEKLKKDSSYSCVYITRTAWLSIKGVALSSFIW